MGRLIETVKGNPTWTVCWISVSIIGVLIWQLRVTQNENLRLQRRYEAVMERRESDRERLKAAYESPEVDLADTVSEIVAEDKAQKQ